MTADFDADEHPPTPIPPTDWQQLRGFVLQASRDNDTPTVAELLSKQRGVQVTYVPCPYRLLILLVRISPLTQT